MLCENNWHIQTSCGWIWHVWRWKMVTITGAYIKIYLECQWHFNACAFDAYAVSTEKLCCCWMCYSPRLLTRVKKKYIEWMCGVKQWTQHSQYTLRFTAGGCTFFLLQMLICSCLIVCCHLCLIMQFLPWALRNKLSFSVVFSFIGLLPYAVEEANGTYSYF